MFVSEKLVFVELHKTGGTHICRWLGKLVGGEQRGKHNRVPPDLQDRFILGSVRNPWDWYVSLWAFGCGGEGSVRRQTTRKIDLCYMHRQLNHEMGQRRLSAGQWWTQLCHDLVKPVGRWRDVYRDPEDATAFRQWLRLIMDPGRRYDVGEGFGFSPVSSRFGLLTYRYLKLFTDLGPLLYVDSGLRNLDGLRDVWNARHQVDFVIRNENLETDLLDALAAAGCQVSDSNRAALLEARTRKTNTSRRRETNYYYDQETSALVAEREALVVGNHGYVPPV